MDNQQRPTVWHRELCPMLRGSLEGKGDLGENGSMLIYGLVSLLFAGNYHNVVSQLYFNLGFPGGSIVKNLPVSARDVGSISGWERPPGEGNGNPLQNSCLGNAMDKGAWWATVHRVTKSRT